MHLKKALAKFEKTEQDNLDEKQKLVEELN